MLKNVYHNTKEGLFFAINYLYYFTSKLTKQIDKTVFFAIIFVIFFGFITMLSVAPAASVRIGIDKYQMIAKQLFILGISISIMVFIALSDQEKVVLYSNIFCILCILLLAATLFFGIDIKGSKRWISIGFMSIQPSEILKPFFVIVNAKILLNTKKNYKKSAIKSLIFISLVVLLLLLEPDFGMSVIFLLTSGFQMFIAGMPIVFLYRIAVIFALLCLIAFLALPHVKYRILSFSGKEDSGYQVKKALQSIQEGGFLGKGPGNGSIKYQLPDAHTDFIFSVICEEFGYIIAATLIAIFMFIIIRNMILITQITQNFRNILIVYGSMFMFAMQIFINIGVNLHILPNKGMTLPFISYGGSALLGMSIMFGVVLCLTKEIYSAKSSYSLINSPF